MVWPSTFALLYISGKRWENYFGRADYCYWSLFNLKIPLSKDRGPLRTYGWRVDLWGVKPSRPGQLVQGSEYKATNMCERYDEMEWSGNRVKVLHNGDLEVFFERIPMQVSASCRCRKLTEACPLPVDLTSTSLPTSLIFSRRSSEFTLEGNWK